MSTSEETYTYQAGEKIRLTKQPDQFVVRAKPERLEEEGIAPVEHVERVSPASSRVTTRAADLERQMSEARHMAPTHHAYQIADSGQEFLITDRIFVTFRDPLTAEQVAAFAGRYGLVIKDAYSDREYLFQLTDHTGMNPVKLVVKLTEEEPLVERAEHDLNYRASVYELPAPTDPVFTRQWHLHTRLVNANFDRRASSRCEDAWQLLGHRGAPEVVVGVTDDGCKLNHRDFDSLDKFAAWGYFEGERLVKNTDIDAEPGRMHQAGANHGTSCAGVIAAEADAVLTVGAAAGCRLVPIKWESDGPSLFISDSKLLKILEFVADKIDVLSNSWGIVPTSLHSTTVTNRIAALARTGGRRGKGIVFLWAAGNDNCPIQHQTNVNVPFSRGWRFNPDGSRTWIGVDTARTFRNSLVGIAGVMHVAALASNAHRSHYSNYGTGIGICAPTNNSHEYLRLLVPGLGISTTTGSASEVTEQFGGTSSATPLVAGITALTISANPELTALELISILKQTASKDLSMEGYPRTPPATFDLNPTWDISPIAPFDQGAFTDVGDPDGTWSPWFGHGRVDAAEAVRAAQGRRPAPSASLRFTSNPERAIPDNGSDGIQDVIGVSDAGLIQEIRVGLDISHPWIGDLRVRLTSPAGTSVTLHDRAGADGDNIRQTYDTARVPALAALRNQSMSGDWLLQVWDLAAQDTGTLKNWGLEIAPLANPRVAEDTASVRIPDNDSAGVVRGLELPAGPIQEIAVLVDITHPWIGDLSVVLTPPGGAPIRLHDQAGGDADNLVRTWRSLDLPALRALQGREAGGRWQLQVADVARRDEGKLNRWRLEIIG